MSKLNNKFLQNYSLDTLRDADLSGVLGDRYQLGFNNITSKWEPISPEFEDKYFAFFNENEVISSTTNIGLVLKLQVATGNLIPGMYYIEYELEYGSSRAGKTQGYQVNWRELGVTAFTAFSDITEDSVVSNRPYYAFALVPVTGNNPLQLQILFGRAGGGGNEVTIQRIRTRVMRFSP